MGKNNLTNSLVSIIMPAFNAAKFIHYSIEGVLNQSYKNIELIICDDFSTDNTREVVSQYAAKDQRIRLILNDENIGIAGARNNCISAASGEIIAFCDADDVWRSDKLDLQITKIFEGNYSIVSSNCDLIDELGSIVGSRIYPEIITPRMLRFRNFIVNSSAIYRRSAHDFPFCKIKHEDYLFWLNLSRNKSIFCYQEPLVAYRVHADNFTHNKFKSFCWQYFVWRKRGESALVIPLLFLFNLLSRLR